jgi:hypothetical protein
MAPPTLDFSKAHRMLQRDLHQQLRTESAAARDHIAALVRPLDAARLNEHPEPKGWSIGEVLEHLLIADELYDDSIAKLLASSRPDAGAALREWKPSFLGRWIAESLMKPKKLKGPPAFRVRHGPRNGVVEAFLAHELTFVQVMDDAVRYDWNALRLRSPALPPFTPKLNLGDAFRVHVVHVTRHAKQVERLAKQL